MTLAMADLVLERVTVTGSGDVTLGGSVTGYDTFASKMSVGDTAYYAIIGTATGDHEVGRGTYATGNKLQRTTVLSSSNSGGLVSFTAQLCDVMMVIPAALVLGLINQETRQVTIGQPGAGQIIHAPVAVKTIIPANLAGSKSSWKVNPSTSAAVFTLTYSQGGTVSTFGTISIATTGVVTWPTHAAVLLDPANGDWWELTYPNPQNASLANGGLTFLFQRG